MKKLDADKRDNAQLALAQAFQKATKAVIMASKAKTYDEAIKSWEMFESAAADFDLARVVIKELQQDKKKKQ